MGAQARSADGRLQQARAALAGVPRVVSLVWSAHPIYFVALVAVNALQGLRPVLGLWLTKLLIDTIVEASRTAGGSGVGQARGALVGLQLEERAHGGVLGAREMLMRLFELPDTPIAGTLVSLLGLAILLRLTDHLIDPAAALIQRQLGDHLSREIQTRILRKANSLQDLSHFENPRFYDALERAQQEAGWRPAGTLARLVTFFRLGVQLITLVVAIAAVQPVLVGLSLALSVPHLMLQLRNQVDTYALTKVSTPEVRKMRYFIELLTGQTAAKEIRLLDLGQHILDRYMAEFKGFRLRFAVLRWRHFRWDAALSAVTALGGWLLYLLLVLLTLGGRLSIGGLLFASQALWQARARLADIVSQLVGFYADVLFVGHVFEFLDTPPVLEVRPRGLARRAPVPLRHGIEFRGVTFVYPGTTRPVVQELSFRLGPNECVALVGENGAGKTTIVKLLGRLYDPTAGSILVDGVDLRELDLEDWRQQLATIFQDFGQYVGTARTNIGLGHLARLEDLEWVRQAAVRAGADRLIEDLPQAYETLLGRWISVDGVEGVDLSGGEWQKVAIARAFMRTPDWLPSGPASAANAREHVLSGASASPLVATRESAAGDPSRRSAGSAAAGPDPRPDAPPAGAADEYQGAQLLILDEPTAALDPQAEHDVYARFRELTHGRMTLLISHRFSTVKMADRIVVVEGGRLVEEGTHEELVALHGIYADLYEKQAARYR